jgi:hypothetical protein
VENLEREAIRVCYEHCLKPESIRGKEIHKHEDINKLLTKGMRQNTGGYNGRH